MKTLFLENHILDDSVDAPTVTRLICQQAMQCPPIMYGQHVHYLWPQCSKDDYRSCIFSLRAVIDVALAEVDAELSGPVLDMCVWLASLMLALCGLAGCFQRVVGGCKQAVG